MFRAAIQNPCIKSETFTFPNSSNHCSICNMLALNSIKYFKIGNDLKGQTKAELSYGA